MIHLIINKILPINMIFILGFCLKKFNILKKEDGKIYLKSVFFAFTPALIFQSIRHSEFSKEMAVYPIIIFLFQLLVYFLGILFTKKLNISSERKVIVRASLIIINTGFLIPFYIAFRGLDNLWRLSLFDFGNSLFVFVIVYSMFLDIKLKESIKLLKSPPIIAMFLGMIVGYYNIPVPQFLDSFLTTVGNLTGIAIMLGLGLYFSPVFRNLKLTLPIVLFKMIFGIIVGGITMHFIPIQHESKIALFYMLASPIGTNILTFTVLANLEIAFAVEIVSLSILLNLFIVPFLFIATQHL